jgi:deazaflavin-dependent oxidoreductase (nitroreductase family)
MKGNDFVAWLLRSPFHGAISRGILLITVTGRKTGRRISTPVSYWREGGSLWVMSGRDRTWWRNLTGGAPVTVRLQGRDVQARAEPVLEEAVVAERLSGYLRRLPGNARYIDVRMEHGEPNAGDVAREAKKRLMVRIDL